MTPEQLSDRIVDVLTALTEEGSLTLPDGVPATVVVVRRDGGLEQMPFDEAFRRATSTSAAVTGLTNGETYRFEVYAVNKKGEYAGACCYEGSSFAVADAKGARLEKCAFMYKASEQPRGSEAGARPEMRKVRPLRPQGQSSRPSSIPRSSVSRLCPG